jgi:hypothetical protein
MSKDKGTKNIKKAPADKSKGGGKPISDYKSESKGGIKTQVVEKSDPKSGGKTK